jgi:V-type H+-transporting ATPase subunit D
MTSHALSNSSISLLLASGRQPAYCSCRVKRPFIVTGRRQILKKIVDTKTAMGENLRAAAFALTEARYAAGDFRFTVFDNVDQPTVKVHSVCNMSRLMPRCASTTPDVLDNGYDARQSKRSGVILTYTMLGNSQVKASMDNVAGVKIPKFEQFTEGVDNKMALTGLGAGGKAIQARNALEPRPAFLSRHPPFNSPLACSAR